MELKCECGRLYINYSEMKSIAHTVDDNALTSSMHVIDAWQWRKIRPKILLIYANARWIII